MNADGSLNLSMIERQAKALAENRVSGAFICGTTGEGHGVVDGRTDEGMGELQAGPVYLNQAELLGRR